MDRKPDAALDDATDRGGVGDRGSTPVACGTAAAASVAPSVDALFMALYDELKRLARRHMARERGGLGVTTLLHEAWLDMARRDALAFPDEARFLAYASRTMRTLIVDQVREAAAAKRGGGHDFTVLDTELSERIAAPDSLSELGAALDRLDALEPALARVVDLKYFCGFTVGEIAAIVGASERTVERQWQKARAWLYAELAEPPADGTSPDAGT